MSLESGASSTSNNADITSKRRRALMTQENYDHNEDDTIVGLFEESEEPERQAALNSAPKGKKRLTSAHLVKIERGTAPPKLVSRKDRFKNTNGLVHGCQDGGVWRRSFIPTYLKIIGSRIVKDAWVVDVSDAEAILDKIWGHIYGTSMRHDWTFSFIANQNVMEWRNGFGSAALAIVQAFFDDSNWDDQTRQEFATTALDYFRFLYSRVIESGNDQKPKRKGVFHGALVPILTALDGPTNKLSLGDVERPMIALALSAAAVERALTLWRDGNITCESVASHKASIIINTTPGNGTEFNEANWGKAANAFLRSIKANLVGDQKRDEKFDKIVVDAKKFAILTRSATNPSADLSVMQVEGGVDERAFLCDDESDFDID